MLRRSAVGAYLDTVLWRVLGVSSRGTISAEPLTNLTRSLNRLGRVYSFATGKQRGRKLLDIVSMATKTRGKIDSTVSEHLFGDKHRGKGSCMRRRQSSAKLTC